MSGLFVVKVNTLPLELAANTLYLVKSSVAGLFDFYVTDIAGTAVRHISTQAETISAVMYYGETEPDANSTFKLWWNTEELVLYIKHTVGANAVWVENTPNVAIPEFAGNGTANTMARSDHHHNDTYATIGANEW